MVFKFKAEFGWSEVIALIAVIVSIAALVQSFQANSPKISVSALPVRSDVACVQAGNKGQWKVVALVPFSITNNGGRTATFTGIRPNPNKDIPAVTALSNRQEVVFDVPYQLYLVDSNVKDAKKLNEAYPKIQKYLNDDQRFRLIYSPGVNANPPVLSVPIPSGETIYLLLGFDSFIYKDNAELLNFDLNMVAEFSNGQSLPLQSSVGVRIFRGQCE